MQLVKALGREINPPPPPPHLSSWEAGLLGQNHWVIPRHHLPPHCLLAFYSVRLKAQMLLVCFNDFIFHFLALQSPKNSSFMIHQGGNKWPSVDRLFTADWLQERSNHGHTLNCCLSTLQFNQESFSGWCLRTFWIRACANYLSKQFLFLSGDLLRVFLI